MIWDQEAKICSIIEFGCPSDINIIRKVNEKLKKYGLLVRNLQIMYPVYKFKVAATVIGTMEYVTKCLINV